MIMSCREFKRMSYTCISTENILSYEQYFYARFYFVRFSADDILHTAIVIDVC